MDSTHPFSDAIRKGLEAVTSGVDEGMRRLKELVEPGQTDAVQVELADDEFASMVADLGVDATSSDEAETRLRLAQSTIDELRANLEHLQPIGDRFAEAEKARLALLDELRAMRADAKPSAAHDTKLERTVQRLRTEVARRDRRILRMTGQLERLRARYDERDRIAKEHWALIKELRAELKEAKRAARAKASDAPRRGRASKKATTDLGANADGKRSAKGRSRGKRETAAKRKKG